MANGIYKVTSHQRYLGQAIVNTFWYRSVLEGTFGTDLLIDGAKALGESFCNHVWATHWRGLCPTNLYFDGVSVMGYNDQFELLYNNTITVIPDSNVLTGSDGNVSTFMALANCVNVAFSLKNRLIANPLFKPPHKGLVAISPIQEASVGPDGTLGDVATAAYQLLADDFAKKLPWDYVDIDLPFVGWSLTTGLNDAFVPIRAKTWQWDLPQVIGGLTVYKHIETTDVENAMVRKLLGYRRSRRVEA